MFIRSFVAVLTAALIAGCGATSGGATPRATPTEPTLRPPLAGSYAALGASETYGIGATPHTSGYAYKVAAALPARTFVDVGIPGTTLDAGFDTELTKALNARPSFCTVFFGVNDINAGVTRASFLADMHDLVATLRQSGAQVLIVGLPDISRLPAVRRRGISGLKALASSWNTGMQKIAAETGAHFLDLQDFSRELATHPNDIAPDGLHPSNRGHARLATLVLAAVRHNHLWRTG